MKITIYYKKNDIDQWTLEIGRKKFKVRVGLNDFRIYDIPNKVVKVEHNEEYVTLTFFDGSFYSLKFEDDDFFVCDSYDNNHDFVDSIANWDFDDDFDYCQEYPNSEVLLDEDGNCSLCGGDCGNV